MKRLVVCCDGTWDTLRDAYPTNVVKLARAINIEDINGILQLVYYDEGIGSNSIFDRLPGGAFGIGLERDISDAYAFICLNYEPGDEIYLFGFSRGAYTVRCLAQLIGDYGILHRSSLKLIPKIYWHYRLPRENGVLRSKQLTERMTEKERGWGWFNWLFTFVLTRRQNPFYEELEQYVAEEYHQNLNQLNFQQKKDVSSKFLQQWFEQLCSVSYQDAKITVLGCFDTVVQVGIPDVTGWLPLEKVKCNLDFRNNIVNSKVELALHALAIDEQRRFLRHTAMETEEDSQTRLKQVWFVGNHGCVGSGSNNFHIYQMANIPLNWMIEEIKQEVDNEGLNIDDSKLHQPEKFINDDQLNPSGDFEPLGEFKAFKWLVKFLQLDFLRYSNKNNRKIEENHHNKIHESVCQRLCEREDYKPKNLTIIYQENCREKNARVKSSRVKS